VLHLRDQRNLPGATDSSSQEMPKGYTGTGHHPGIKGMTGTPNQEKYRLPEDNGTDPRLFLGEAAGVVYLNGLAAAERTRATLAADEPRGATWVRAAGSSVVNVTAMRTHRSCQLTREPNDGAVDHWHWTTAGTLPRGRMRDCYDHLAHLPEARGSWGKSSGREPLSTSTTCLPKRTARRFLRRRWPPLLRVATFVLRVQCMELILRLMAATGVLGSHVKRMGQGRLPRRQLGGVSRENPGRPVPARLEGPSLTGMQWTSPWTNRFELK
jgi:hypothetical protein